VARSTGAQPLWMPLIVCCAMLTASPGVAHAQLSPAQQAYTAGTYAGQHAAERFFRQAPPDADSHAVKQRAIEWAVRESAACQAEPNLTCDMENMGRLPPGTEQDFMRGFRDGFDLGSIGAIR
jgi:hypothetical protein